MEKTVELLNVDNPAHAEFLYDVAMACKDYYFNDYDNDIIVMIQQSKQAIQQGLIKAFLAKVEDKPVGIIWVERDHYDIGFVRAGIMPEYRNGVFAKYFLNQFVKFCFEKLGFRKLVATFTTEQKTIERLLRDMGFTKEGLLKEELVKDGRPVDLLRLALLKGRYEALSYEP